LGFASTLEMFSVAASTRESMAARAMITCGPTRLLAVA
jgi:hypothetical protein